MEAVGTMQEGEWGAFGGMFSNDETNFMAQFINTYPFPSEHNGGMSLDTSSTFWPTHEPVMNAATGFDESLYYCQDKANCNSFYLPRDISHTRDTSTFFPTSTSEQNFYLNNNSFNPMEFCLEEQNPSDLNIVTEEVAYLKDEMSSDSLGDSEGSLQNAVVIPDPKLNSKRKCVMIQPDRGTEGENNNSSESPKKKAKVSGHVRKNKKSIQSMKNQGNAQMNTIEEGTNADTNGHSSSSYTSEDDTNAPQETSNSKGSDVLDLSCKSRASRGSATDPQSIYARKRRERINERLRILQNLVPNGTKVDISTMLEEAVQYVKFLQVQIKLLSSDDLWMYAPLAYNGMDIGLDLKITLPR